MPRPANGRATSGCPSLSGPCSTIMRPRIAGPAVPRRFSGLWRGLACGTAVVEAVTGRLRSRSSPDKELLADWVSDVVPSAKRVARLMPQRALRFGLHGGATTASWGFVRMAPSPRSPDNRGMLRGVPAVGRTRASSRDDVGSWTVRSPTEALLLVERSANRRAGARA